MDLLINYWPVVAAIIVVFWLAWLRRTGEDVYPYEKKPAMMSRNEQAFYYALLRAVGKQYDVFAMVRIADLLVVDTVQKRQSWQNRINCKHIDFVLCDMKTQEPLLAIEVDDRSHQRKDRQERDYFVDRAFAAAQLPLLRVVATRNYVTKEVQQVVNEILTGRLPKKLASERRVKVG